MDDHTLPSRMRLTAVVRHAVAGLALAMLIVIGGAPSAASASTSLQTAGTTSVDELMVDVAAQQTVGKRVVQRRAIARTPAVRHPLSVYVPMARRGGHAMRSWLSYWRMTPPLWRGPPALQL